MNEATDLDLKKWLSTYGILTAERVLETFNIRLKHDELITAIKNPRSIYYQLLRVPLKNIFNGIILQQTQDYQVYAQKLFIDYLLSGENEKDASAPGANTREEIEEERKKLINLGDEFSQLEIAHQTLIGESQLSLIKLSRELQNSLNTVAKKCKAILQHHGVNQSQEAVMQAIKVAIIHYDLSDEMLAESSSFWDEIEKNLGISLNREMRSELSPSITQFHQHKAEIDQLLSSYLTRAEEIAQNLRLFRKRFFDTILKANELIKSLPDYHPDEAREKENLQSLNFDREIGEVHPES